MHAIISNNQVREKEDMNVKERRVGRGTWEHMKKEKLREKSCNYNIQNKKFKRS